MRKFNLQLKILVLERLFSSVEEVNNLTINWIFKNYVDSGDGC